MNWKMRGFMDKLQNMAGEGDSVLESSMMEIEKGTHEFKGMISRIFEKNLFFKMIYSIGNTELQLLLKRQLPDVFKIKIRSPKRKNRDKSPTFKLNNF